MYVNGEEVSLSHNIKANDVITLEESTLGTPAQEKVADLIDYNGKIVVYLKGDEMPLPKPVKVNGTAVTEEYLIQNGDEIVVASAYTYDEFFEYMGLSPDDMILFINGARADDTMEICASDQLEFKNRKEYELKEIYKESHIELHSEKRRETKKEGKAKTEEIKAAEVDQPVEEKTNAEEADEGVKSEPESKAEENNSESESKTEKTDSEAEISEGVKTETKSKTEEQPEPENETEEKEKPEPEDKIEEQAESVSKTKEVKEEPVREPEGKTEENKHSEQTHEDSRQEQTHNSARTERKEKHEEKKRAAAKEKEEPPVDSGKKIIVIVNQKPVVMRGKQNYMFVDIFDYIDFDTSRMQGSGIATLVNGKDAQYTQELYNGDKIEVYWK